MSHVAPLRYCLEPHDLAGHRCRVSLTIEHPDPQGQQVSLPAWIPGSYLMREFARQIETLQAYDAAGKTIGVHKLDRNTWQLAPCKGAVTIKTVVYCNDMSVRSAHLDDSHGFFNGTSLFLQVHGQEDQPCLLELLPPPANSTYQQQTWQVHTSLPEAKGWEGAAQRHGFGYYLAPNYDALIDHPIEMGTPTVASFEAYGAEHELIFTGIIPGLDLERIVADVKRICETQIRFFEPETQRAPFLDSSDRYVFMTQVLGEGYGGLEHRASTALICNRRDLPIKGRPEQSEGYRNFLGLVSHEYFHTWNVKRIKPAVFAPYDLSREGHTRLLWVFEGFTSYYDDLLLFRAGVIDQPTYLANISRTISMVHRNGGRHKQSVAESSFDAWTRYYRQDENSPNALVSYYTKGALVALGLDLFIRRETLDRHSLDDVLRLMWDRYGRDFYLGAPKGVAEDAMPALIHEATGVDAGKFLQLYAEGRHDVPLDKLLPIAGLRLEWRAPNNTLVGIDWRTRNQGEEVQVATVYEGGNAHLAGLSAGDRLVAIDGLRVTSSNLDSILGRYAVGDTISLHLFRSDVLRQFKLTLTAPGKHECHVVANARP